MTLNIFMTITNAVMIKFLKESYGYCPNISTFKTKPVGNRMCWNAVMQIIFWFQQKVKLLSLCTWICYDWRYTMLGHVSEANWIINGWASAIKIAKALELRLSWTNPHKCGKFQKMLLEMKDITLQCCFEAVHFFQDLTTNTPLVTHLVGIWNLFWRFNLYFTSVTAMMYAIQCYIRPVIYCYWKQ